MAVLSAAPLNCPFLRHTDTVPFTNFLLHQHGEPIQCIPFSTSPFAVFDVAASHPSPCSIMINEDLSIEPSSVKPNLVRTLPSISLTLDISFNITDICIPSLITSIPSSIRNTRWTRQCQQTVHFHYPSTQCTRKPHCKELFSG